ncbi:MAG: D-alanyl-D-alanine carboxypeptidase/D-alanyl-D-alanine endopeptidase [Rubrivivax sp.]|jgi:D-alanyl-D-alanine carboxypeptidase/D-alanyl-D-alanine-endopeptidase (penicillin-binding protein 4)
MSSWRLMTASILAVAGLAAAQPGGAPPAPQPVRPAPPSLTGPAVREPLPPGDATALEAAVQALARAAHLPQEAVAVVVAPLRPEAPGQRFVSMGADRALQPASTMKVLTTLAGLELLGPTWRGSTRLLRSGPLEQGVLHGDLVLEGGADMDLSADALQALLRKARDRGVEVIRGDLILDRSAFRPTRSDLGLPPFDEAPEFEYNLIPDALTVDSNLLRMDLAFDAAGTLQIHPHPRLHGLHVRHEFNLVDAPCARWGDGWKTPQVRRRWLDQAEVVLHGTWPRGCERSLALNLIDRDEFIGRLVRRQWADLGGHWHGRTREAVTPPGAVVLADRQSRPLSELVRSLNKVSDNARTRTLLLAIGRQASGADDEPTLQRADRAVRAWMARKGIADAGLVLDNGSGLSRTEKISAGQLEAVLRAGMTGPWAPEFLASLPVVGVDGLMRWRQSDGSVPLQARLKPGGLRNVVSVAGTVNDAAGHPMIVVVIVNHDNARAAVSRSIIDTVLQWVSTTRFGPRAGP